MTNCQFRYNTVTPMRVVNAAVSATTMVFESNVVNAAPYQESGCPTSAGLAIWRDPRNANQLHRIRLSNCEFRNNTLRTSSNLTGDQEGNAAMATAGGALNIVLTTNHERPPEVTADQVYIDIENTRFNKNNAILQALPPVLLSKISLAHGGAVSVKTSGFVEDNLIRFRNCTWTNNSAVRGGGIAFGCYGSGKNNTVIVEQSCRFEDNLVSDQNGFGGAINVEVHGNGCSRVQIRQSEFLSNTAFEGGAINVALHPYRPSCVQVSVTNCTFIRNQAQLGAAMNWWAGHKLLDHDSMQSGYLFGTDALNVSSLTLVIEDSQFSDNIAFYRGVVAVTNIELAMKGKNEFQSNANTALLLQMAVCYLAEGAALVFLNNSGLIGGGILLQESRFIVDDYSSIIFHNNTALSKGGGLFVANKPV